MKIRLYAKPVRAPKWWPRDEKRRARWVGLLSNGIGWVVGYGDWMTTKQAKMAKQAFLDDQVDDRGRRRAFQFIREKRK